MSSQGIKSKIQKTQLTGDRRGDALPEARRAPPWQGRGNAAMWARAPGLWARDSPWPLSPGAYKYLPMGFSWIYPDNRVVFVTLLLGIVVVVSFFF